MAAASYPVAANASRASTTGRSRRRPPADAAVALARMRPPPAEHPQPQRPPGRTSGKAGRFAICECPRPTRVRLRTYCEPSGCIVRSDASIRIAPMLFRSSSAILGRFGGVRGPSSPGTRPSRSGTSSAGWRAARLRRPQRARTSSLPAVAGEMGHPGGYSTARRLPGR